MAITTKQKEKFIEMRAEGFSFDSISEKIKISKPTLIKLQTELDGEISNLKYLMYDTLIEKFKLTQKHKVERLIKHLKKVNDELDKMDFSKLTLRELMLIKDKCQSEFAQLTIDVKYGTGDYQNIMFDDTVLGKSEITTPLH